MDISRFQQGWNVLANGYRWIQAIADDQGSQGAEPHLVAAQIDDEAESWRGPCHNVHPVLHRLFAEISPDEDGILAFANRYGNLGQETKFLTASRSRGNHSGIASGTSLCSWKGQISSMRRLCSLWDLIHQENLAALGRYFTWQESPDGPSVHFDSHPDPFTPDAPPLGHATVRELIPFDASELGLVDSHRTRDVLLLAKLYLQGVLDQHLHHACDEVKVAMVWDSRCEQPTLGYWCPTLVTAVWTQFATVVNEKLTYGRCRECGTWFEVAPKAARASRRFCSTACRSKAYRERQEKARRMFAKKKKIEQIAEELDSDLATVRRWITGFKE